MGQLVDWDLAAATAGALGKAGPNVSYAEATEVVTELRRLTDEAGAHVERFTGLSGPTSPVRVVDRKDWATVNINGLRQVINPLVTKLTGDRDPGAFVSAVGSRVTGVQAGTVLAYLSGKVLGQYEVFSSDPGTLLLVAPNIVEVERKLDVAPRDFRLWVALHEVTHRTQFTAVPWLRGHFLGEVRAFVDAAQSPGEQLAERGRRAGRLDPQPGQPRVGPRPGADAGPEGDPRPAHRGHDPARRARRVRDGRRRPRRRPGRRGDPEPLQPPP
jgi:coenzyme F420 biosynthesis associated uncharacterized protein